MFALALDPLVLRLGEIQLLLNVWYLEDGVLCGKAEDIKKALELLQNYCAEIGLELNLAKCKLFGPGISQFTSFVYDSIPKVPLSEGSVFLGVPIGSDSFVEKALDETIKKLEGLIAKVGQLKSNLVKFLLLRASFGASALQPSIPTWKGRCLTVSSNVSARPRRCHGLRVA